MRPGIVLMMIAVLALGLLPATSLRAESAPVTVDPAWLDTRLRETDLITVDMTDDDLQYTRYHIPGAVRLAYAELLAAPARGKPPVPLNDAQLAALLGQLGIGRDTQVVIYDDVGGLNAGRLFLELERIGHPRVSVLDGGLVKWVLEGRKVDNVPVIRKPVVYRPGPQRRANVAMLDDVKRASSGVQPGVLLDVRSRDEYTGNPKEARSGHIPGARWWPWEQAVRMESGFTLREADSLLASLTRAEVKDLKTPVILYCRSGHRASQSYLALRRLGFENVRVYAGSMNDYLTDRQALLVRGLSP